MKSFSKETLNNYLKLLSSSKPAPGGGSAAAAVSALGFSLLEKVAAVSREKKKYSFRKEMREAKRLTREALKLADKDAKAYAQVIKAYRLKAVSDSEKKIRRKKIDEALTGGFQVPYELLLVLKKGKLLRARLFAKCDGAIASDLEVAGDFFRAADKSSHHLAHSNLDYIKDKKLKAQLTAQLEKIH